MIELDSTKDSDPLNDPGISTGRKTNLFENSVWEQPTWLYCDLIYFLSRLQATMRESIYVKYFSRARRTELQRAPDPGY